jgi:hypothetical protein
MSADNEPTPSFLQRRLKMPPLFSSAIMERLAEEALLADDTSFPQRLTASLAA